VTAFTTDNGTVTIDNNRIAQPDTIGITFNKPLDTYTVNPSTIQLFAQDNPTPLAAAVAYSPTTDTAYLTPETALLPGPVYFVRVGGAVSDDQGFPNPGVTLGTTQTISFTVASAGAGPGKAPLTVVQTNPLSGTEWTSPLGYGAVTFSEPITLSSLGRFSAMLVPQTGGVTTGGSGYADVPLNAKLAFNPNTNQLIIVPTEILRNDVVYLFALSGITATNGNKLAGTVFATFLWNTGGSSAANAAMLGGSLVTIPDPQAVKERP
jgi:hypothetical protein